MVNLKVSSRVQGVSAGAVRYLFVIAINVISLLVNRASNDGKIGFHHRCRELSLTHLSFADDLMVFMDGSAISLRGIIEVLKEFESNSGLVIASQSSLYMAGRTLNALQEQAVAFGTRIEQLPIRYLGMPLTTKSMSRLDYEPLIDKIKTRLISWSSKTLSFVGRLQLIQSIIASITNFWCSAFLLPKRCFNTIENMCAAFFWLALLHITTKAKWLGMK